MRGVFTMKTNSVTEKTFGREQIIRIVIAAIAIALTYVFTAFCKHYIAYCNKWWSYSPWKRATFPFRNFIW